jgi:hypothetical protein
MTRQTLRSLPAPALLIALALASASANGQHIDLDRYLWQTPRAEGIDRHATRPLRRELTAQIDRILAAGPLAPIRLAYGDITYEAHYLYLERGRVITTLAWAWPHVPVDRQADIRTYVRKLLADPVHAPHQPGIKKANDGARRELHQQYVPAQRYPDPNTVPTAHVLYGLWLYVDRSGDLDAVRPRWAKLVTRYRQAIAQEPVLYGRMGAHIGMARLARALGDDATLALARRSLAADLKFGQDPSRVAGQLAKTRFKHLVTSGRAKGFFPGKLFMLLDAPPEILRFLADHAPRDLTARADAFARRYPLWWLYQAQYFTRWTGDESVGLTSEAFGMVFPIRRWIETLPAEKRSTIMRSAPVGIGDCYWLEALAQTIEAHGRTHWRPVNDAR